MYDCFQTAYLVASSASIVVRNISMHGGTGESARSVSSQFEWRV